MELISDIQELDWLSAGAQQLPDRGYTGFRPQLGDNNIWILHAMYEFQEAIPNISHDELRRLRIKWGEIEPEYVNGVSLEDLEHLGIPHGRTGHPGLGYERLLWAERAAQVSAPMAASGVPPCFRWFPTDSWPARIRPPAEGSIDRESFLRLVEHLIAVSPQSDAAPCLASYSPLATRDWSGPPVVYRGTLAELPSLYDDYELDAAPTNIWPDDRDWLTYSDWDLLATQVSGSTALIERIVSDPELESISYP